MRLLVLIASLAGLLAGSSPAAADFLYTFSYTPFVNSAAPIQSFSFSLSSPGFISDSTLTPPPFGVTDGVHTWNMTQGRASNDSGNACFAFTTSGVSIDSTCGTTIFNLDGRFRVTFVGASLPTSVGTFVPSNFEGQFLDLPRANNEIIGGSAGGDTGTAQLQITEIGRVPFPATIALLLGGFSLTAVGTWRRRRFKTTASQKASSSL